jgi:DNA-binding transcriptional MerR regulator
VEDRLRIGELSARHGLSTAAVRYYESLGLLGEAERTPSGYRLFSSDDEERLRFILRAKALDLSLEEIRSLLDAWHQGGSCRDTRATLRHLVAHKIQEARTQAREAEAFAAQLTHVYVSLGEEVGPSQTCGCIPDLPAPETVDLDAELALIQGSICDCSGRLDEASTIQACACGCCAPEAASAGTAIQLSTRPKEEVTTP